MGLPRIVNNLYFQPWLISENTHRSFARVLDGYLGGMACDMADFAPSALEPYKTPEGVAIIPIQGPVGMRLSPIERQMGGKDFAEIQDHIRMMEADDEVIGVVLHIDSPGGMVNGTEETANMIRALSTKKPTASFTDSMIASAAYWMASQTSHIVATESAEIGSIGVYMAVLDESRQYEMDGLKVDVIKAGKLKGAGISGTSLSEAQRAHLQGQVNGIHARFKEAVRMGRDVKDEDMEGQTHDAHTAAQNGLIEDIGTIEKAIAWVLENQNLNK